MIEVYWVYSFLEGLHGFQDSRDIQQECDNRAGQ